MEFFQPLADCSVPFQNAKFSDNGKAVQVTYFTVNEYISEFTETIYFVETDK